MNLTNLKYALEVEKCGSVTKAAEKLAVSQPNLSKMIKDLEQEVGFRIFVRKNKGMVPTLRGRDFLESANHVMEQFHNLEAFCESERKDRVELSVAVPRASYITHGFMKFMNAIDNDACEMDINFSETSSLDAINDVVEQKSSTGIIRYDTRFEKYFLSLLQLKGLDYTEIFEFEYVFVISKENHLAKRESIVYDDLKHSVEILHGDTKIPSLAHGTPQEYREKTTNRVVYVYERGSQFDLLADEKNTFMWVSPLPREILDRYHLVQKKCCDYRRFMKDVFIFPKGYQLTRYEKMFVDEVRKVVGEMH